MELCLSCAVWIGKCGWEVSVLDHPQLRAISEVLAAFSITAGKNCATWQVHSE